MASELAAVVMAAGLGTRMKSATRSTCTRCSGVVSSTGSSRRCAHSGGSARRRRLTGSSGRVGRRDRRGPEQPLGTGDSLRAARESVGDAQTLLVVSGDHPRISSDLLERWSQSTALRQRARPCSRSRPPDARAYGRIVRDDAGRLEAIVEDVDADETQRAIGEVNSSIYVFGADKLWPVWNTSSRRTLRASSISRTRLRLLVEGERRLSCSRLRMPMKWKE